MSRGRISRNHVTIKDIALALSVSHTTVSRALNDSPLISGRTKELVRARAAEMGYVPDSAARVMRGELSNIVGFILPDVQNHFYSAMAKVLAETVATEGLQLVLAISEDDPHRELRHVRALHRAQARGIVITPVAGLLEETAALLAETRTVQLVRRHPLVAADVVTAADGHATYLSTRHLLDLGHRSIGYVGGGSETLSTGLERVDGFRRAMAEAPSARGAERLVSPRPDSGFQAAGELLGDSGLGVTGLVMGSSQLTLGALRAIRARGLDVADDISLISYDDPDWHELWGPGITTIALPIRQIARYAASRICDAGFSLSGDPGPSIETAGDSRRISFPVEVVIRGSCRSSSQCSTR